MTDEIKGLPVLVPSQFEQLARIERGFQLRDQLEQLEREGAGRFRLAAIESPIARANRELEIIEQMRRDDARLGLGAARFVDPVKQMRERIEQIERARQIETHARRIEIQLRGLRYDY